MSSLPNTNIFNINQIRCEAGVDEHGRSYTYSKLYVPADLGVANQKAHCYGHILEDTERPPGVKVYKETAIPCGTYYARVTYSNKFKRDTILLSSTPDTDTCNYEGVKFTYIRVHGGNTVKDTDGCQLLAENYLGDGVIQGSNDRALTAAIKNVTKFGHTVLWTISRVAYT